MRSFVTHKGQVTWFDFDECDSDLFDGSKWQINVQGYIFKSVYLGREQGKTKNKYVSLHRLIAERMGLDMSKKIDHINGNIYDNRRCNLRAATNQENSFNARKSKNNKSGYKGVSWDKLTNKWRSQIMVNRKSIKLGRFESPELAYQAYCEAAKKYHGEFANFG